MFQQRAFQHTVRNRGKAGLVVSDIFDGERNAAQWRAGRKFKCQIKL
jgi:hypothetical protein